MENSSVSEIEQLKQQIEEHKNKLDELNKSKMSLNKGVEKQKKVYDQVDSALKQEMRNKQKLEAKLRIPVEKKTPSKKAVDNSVDLTRLNQTLRSGTFIEETKSLDRTERSAVQLRGRSLDVEKENFETFEEFGIYLIDHIEKEQLAKRQYNQQEETLTALVCQQLPGKDSMMLSFLVELWDKLEVSYQKRILLLKEMGKR